MSLVRFRPEAPCADLAHLVERDLAKVEVAGSIPVIRSRNADTKVWSDRVRKFIAIREAERLSVDIRRGSRKSGMLRPQKRIWRHSQVVRQRSAKPLFPGSNPGGASKQKSTARAVLFCLGRCVPLARNEMCTSCVMFPLEVMCASRVRMRNTSHHFAPQAQYITMAKPSHHFGVADTALFTNSPKCDIIKPERRWRYAHKKTRLYNGHRY